MATRTTTRVVNASRTTDPTAPAPKAATRPAAPTRVMTVCLPDELPTDVLADTTNLARHLGVAATATARMWATPGLGPLRRHHMIGLRRGRPAYCAGGPVRLLDLAAMRHGGAVGASLRHQQWSHIVRGTRPATPWPTYHQRHLTDPDKYPLGTATAEFLAQQRVAAMRMHNATLPNPATHLDPYEVEMLQAGPAAYANFHGLWAVCTDALITTANTRLAPASAHLTDWITYLDQANRHLGTLDPDQRLLTVTL